ncbi:MULTISPECIES: hypothetical protein [unclassified Burkholderia]|uniref:hypothetical protein n=1 Tax=unclassified Burkholderia TaxID=2613784 RepID=UPI00075A8C00|nr:MULTISPECIES: hypothetical protein [unclassified Burkholderia]KVN04826.1 hypothetical protein WT08_22205 [Burkholderia sp. MSMB1552]KWZ55746.1 hypothetical protein WS92_07355 [Burkholderia sp. MSMB1588]
MLELTIEQVAALAEIDAKGFVARVCEDLVGDDAKLADDPTLTNRLWHAFTAARAVGIHDDDNLVAFLRVEAYAPSFYEKPATRTWLTRPGHSADERFHDYLRVMRRRIEHPEFVGGLTYGGIARAGSGSSGHGAWASLGTHWRRLVGRSSDSGNS